MSMTKAVYKSSESKSKSRALIKYALYVVLSGVIAYYLQDSIDDFAEYWNLPLRGELLTTMMAIAIGMIVTTMLLFFYERSIRKSGVIMNA